MKFVVIKDIPDGWETDAKSGDILHVATWEGFPTLMKGKKAICDNGSKYHLEHCKPLDLVSADRKVKEVK
ncbi:hypothetical protein [Paenibacillus pinihumi]|uniref:hypothetical protein n=1 Tax=Paenibacillus pinihumi TaxID=669462 RepID=UPI00048B0395|nr:hypothetical protein [Paenibacillus pinihumi]